LKGVLNVQALSAQPEAFITVNDIMKSAGKTVNGAQGGAIEVIKMDKNKNGVYSVKFRLEQPPQFHPATNLNGVLPAAGAGGGGVGVGAKAVGGGALAVAQQIQIQPAQATTAVGFAPMSQGLPVLLDAKGKPLTQISMSSSGRSANGVFVQEITLNFRPDNGAGEPTQFVLFGHRMVNAQVPFQFEKVQLP
jgi:hypothetical protein